MAEIDDLKVEIAKLQKLAFCDHLTGLYNRAGFEHFALPTLENVGIFLQQPKKRKNYLIKCFSLVLIDLDGLKNLNDKFGHLTGDAVLANLGLVIQQNIRSADVVARWGGDEFVLALPGCSANSASQVTRKISLALKNSSQQPRATFSAGIAELKMVESFQELFERADKALYEAKKSGKNKINSSS